MSPVLGVTKQIHILETIQVKEPMLSIFYPEVVFWSVKGKCGQICEELKIFSKSKAQNFPKSQEFGKSILQHCRIDGLS